MKLFKDVSIVRKTNEDIEISWKNQNIEQVNVFYIDKDEKFISNCKGNNKISFKDPNSEKKNIFVLKANGYQNYYISERLVNLKGTSNFRDLGGYKSKDGRHIKWNTFFRSDALCSLLPEDEILIRNLGIKTVLDLRSKQETKFKPNVKIKNLRYINISGMKSLDNKHDNFDMTSIYKDILENENASKYMINNYKMLPFNNNAFNELVQLMDNTYSQPIVFHCSAGKDRTGIGAAIILSILGIPEETIIYDYLLTNIYRKDINEKLLKNISLRINADKINIVRDMFIAKKEYIDAAFNEIRKNYGTIEIYLEKEFGITKKKRKELKNRYLY
ncbi:MAG: tyrosine-protein phosphatase [Clostridiaceae bacterium]|nr:tyrosine-protein phosphatase [Clostridiaceae bacterium]